MCLVFIDRYRMLRDVLTEFSSRALSLIYVDCYLLKLQYLADQATFEDTEPPRDYRRLINLRK